MCYNRTMKQTITLEVENTTVMQLLRNLAEMSLVKFTLDQHSNDGVHTSNRAVPVFGCLEGQIQMSDDFDEPLEDFKEYM